MEELKVVEDKDNTGESSEEMRLTDDEQKDLELHQLRVVSLRQQLENAQLKAHTLELETEKQRGLLQTMAEQVKAAIDKEAQGASVVKGTIENRLGINLSEYRLIEGGVLEKVEQATQPA